MTKPASPRSRASLPANFSPAPEALREPTIAIIGRISASRMPRMPSSGGASSSSEPRRIAGLAGRDQADAEPPACGELGARVLLAANPPRTCRAAAPRQIRQPLQRRARAAEMMEQGTERPRPDIVGPDQPQPVDPLGVGEMYRARILLSMRPQHGSTGRRGEGEWRHSVDAPSGAVPASPDFYDVQWHIGSSMRAWHQAGHGGD